jgi:hypothetical protein
MRHHERAKSKLKALMLEDAKEAIGGVRAASDTISDAKWRGALATFRRFA